MDSSEIQQILNGLDKRLALGEIDMATYRELKKKYEGMRGKPGESPVEEMVSKLPREANKVNCPYCGAPSDIIEGVNTVSCKFCGSDYQLKAAEEEMEELRKDILSWIREISSSGSVVDEASRRFIFKEKIFPVIRMEVQRSTEMYALSKHRGLMYGVIRGMLGRELEENAGIDHDGKQRISRAVTRASSPEVKGFAVSREDRARLIGLRIDCQEIIFINNIRGLIREPSSEDLERVKNNFKALEDLYSEYIAGVEGKDRTFYELVRKRYRISFKAIERVISILGGEAADMDWFDRISQEMSEVKNELDDVEMEMSRLVPVLEGMDEDDHAMTILADVMRIYSKQGGAGSFREFLEDLQNVINWGRPTDRGLHGFLVNIEKYIDVLKSKKPVRIFRETDWIVPVMASNRKTSFFSGDEKADIVSNTFIPFWAYHMEFSNQKGMIFREGYSDQCMVLQAAVNVKDGTIVIHDEDPLYKDMMVVMNGQKQVLGGGEALCPVVGEEAAREVLDGRKARDQLFCSGNLKFMTLVYIPAVEVEYKKRSSSRRMVHFPGGKLKFSDLKVQKVRLGGVELGILV